MCNTRKDYVIIILFCGKDELKEYLSLMQLNRSHEVFIVEINIGLDSTQWLTMVAENSVFLGSLQ